MTEEVISEEDDDDIMIVSAKIKRKVEISEEDEIICLKKIKNSQEVQIQSIKPKTCCICYDEIEEYIYPSYKQCHSFCFGCFKTFLQTSAKDSSNFPLKCCLCDEFVVFQYIVDLTLFLEEEEIERLFKLQTTSLIKLFYCPVCSFPYELNDSDLLEAEGGEVECLECKKKLCVKCCCLYHTNFTCEQYQSLPADQRSNEDLDCLKLAKDSGWSKCPRCKMVVEKQTGCNYILCRCKTSFCYKCGKEYIDTKKASASNSHGTAGCQCKLFDDVQPQPILNPAPVVNHRHAALFNQKPRRINFQKREDFPQAAAAPPVIMNPAFNPFANIKPTVVVPKQLIQPNARRKK